MFLLWLTRFGVASTINQVVAPQVNLIMLQLFCNIKRPAARCKVLQ